MRRKRERGKTEEGGNTKDKNNRKPRGRVIQPLHVFQGVAYQLPYMVTSEREWADAKRHLTLVLAPRSIRHIYDGCLGQVIHAIELVAEAGLRTRA